MFLVLYLKSWRSTVVHNPLSPSQQSLMVFIHIRPCILLQYSKRRILQNIASSPGLKSLMVHLVETFSTQHKLGFQYKFTRCPDNPAIIAGLLSLTNQLDLPWKIIGINKNLEKLLMVNNKKKKVNTNHNILCSWNVIFNLPLTFVYCQCAHIINCTSILNHESVFRFIFTTGIFECLIIVSFFQVCYLWMFDNSIFSGPLPIDYWNMYPLLKKSTEVRKYI